MAHILFSKRGQPNSTAENYVCDQIVDLEKLPKSPLGSMALVIEGTKFYICNSDGEWIEVELGGGGGGGGGGSGTVNSVNLVGPDYLGNVTISANDIGLSESETIKQAFTHVREQMTKSVNGISGDAEGNIVLNANNVPLVFPTGVSVGEALDRLERGKVPLQRSENAAGATVPYYFEIGTAVINGVNGANTKTFVINTTAENVTRPLRFGIFTVSIRNAATSGGNPQAATLQWDICQGFSPGSVRLLWAVSGTSATYKLLFVGDRASEMVHVQVLTHREADNGVWVVNPSPPATTTLPDGYTIVPSTVAQLQPATGGGNRDNILVNYGGAGAAGMINQSGLTEWTAAGYTVDKWILGGGLSLSLSNDVLRLTRTTATTNPTLNQRIENISNYAGRTVTLSARYKTTASDFRLLINDGTSVTQVTLPPTDIYRIVSVTKTLAASITLHEIGIRSGNLGVSGNYIEFDTTRPFAKLELGSVSTLANDTPPNYNEEFLRTTGTSPTQTNPNLLDNPQGNINQSGLTVWTAAEYTVERWKHFRSGQGKVSLSNGVLRMERTATPSEHEAIEEILQAGSLLPNTTYTYSIRYRANHSVSLERTISGVSTQIEVAPSDEYTYGSVTFTTPASISGKLSVLIVLRNSGAAVGDFVEFDTTRPFAKLELGSVSTLANDGPVDYGTELAKCGYYQRVYSTNNVDTQGNFPPMRIAPTITEITTGSQSGKFLYDSNL